jgi:hypothetical protein
VIDTATTAESLGWVATVVFTASYFCARAEALRRVQMIGALMWMTYGGLIGSWPVIVSNALVLGAAAWTSVRGPRVAPESLEIQKA